MFKNRFLEYRKKKEAPHFTLYLIQTMLYVLCCALTMYINDRLNSHNYTDSEFNYHKFTTK